MKEYDKYVRDVISGKQVACLQVRQACERFVELKKRKDIYFDEVAVDECIKFFSLIKHFLGKSKGKPFLLERWQKFLLAYIVGIKYKKTKLRVVREVYIQVARKAGKDAFMAGLSLYFLIVDKESAPEIACLANSREQARILFEYVQKFSLSLDSKEKYIKQYRNYISTPLNNGKVKVFSSDSSKLDGLNVSLGILDEFHEAKSRELYDVIRSSMGMRTQPLMVIITTAGFNLESPCHDKYNLSLEILAGIKKDDSFAPFIYQLDADDDIEDKKNWIKCQPNLGVTVDAEFMRGELMKMKNDSTAEVGIRTKTFNQWCTNETIWVRPEYVVKAMKSFSLEDFRGKRCYVGVDLAAVGDLTAISVMWVDDGKYYFKNFSFLPEDTYKVHPMRELFRKFIAEGSLIITNRNVTDYDLIANKIREINEICPVKAVYYDKWNATQFCITMEDMGFNMIEFSQNIGNFNTCTKEFQRLLLSDGLVIDKSSNFLWQMSCVKIKVDHNGNCKPSKEEYESKKIDNVISSLNALGGYLKKSEKISNDFQIFSM